MAQRFLKVLGSRRRERRRCADARSHNETQSRLYNLAEELLGIIYQNLSFEASVAISLSCARFYRSPVFASVRPDRHSPRETRFQALCMLEYDGNINGHCCRGCLSKHSSAAFSSEELSKQPTERYCLRTKLSLRVGRFQEFSFVDMQKVLGVSKERNAQRGRLAPRLARLFFHPMIIIEDTFYVYPVGQPMYEQDFVAFCCKINFPFCPHMRMGDLKILQLFPPFKNHHAAKPLSCEQCETKVIFSRGFHGDDRWYVFTTRRSIGRLVSPLEPAWLAQTFASKAPGLDKLCEFKFGWFKGYWDEHENGTPIMRFKYPDPDGDRLFTLPTLPKTWSSHVARLRTRARLLTTLPIRKRTYKVCHLPNADKAIDWPTHKGL